MLANVVTSADFDSKPWQLQGLEDVGSSFDDFITYHQNEILLKLLGQKLLDAFSSGVATLPSLWVGTNDPGYAINDQVVYGSHIYKSLVNNNLNIIPSSDPVSWQDLGKNRWAQLYYGDDYVVNNRNFHYNGVKAFLQPYIFAIWLDEQSTSAVSTGGVVTANSENSSSVGPSVKIMEAYIQFKKLVRNVCNSYNQLFNGTGIWAYNQGTLFGFLFANDATYYGDVQSEGDSNLIGYLSAHYQPLGSINDFDF